MRNFKFKKGDRVRVAKIDDVDYYVMQSIKLVMSE